MSDDEVKTAQQMAAEIVASAFNDDAMTVQVADQIAAALDEAGILIDPVDNALWQNLKAGDMTCQYRDGGLLFQVTPKGVKRAKALIGETEEADG